MYVLNMSALMADKRFGLGRKIKGSPSLRADASHTGDNGASQTRPGRARFVSIDISMHVLLL